MDTLYFLDWNKRSVVFFTLKQFGKINSAKSPNVWKKKRRKVRLSGD